MNASHGEPAIYRPNPPTGPGPGIPPPGPTPLPEPGHLPGQAQGAAGHGPGPGPGPASGFGQGAGVQGAGVQGAGGPGGGQPPGLVEGAGAVGPSPGAGGSGYMRGVGGVDVVPGQAQAQGGVNAVPAAYAADQAFAPGGGLAWARISKRHTWRRVISAVLTAVPVAALGAFLVSRDGGLPGAALWIAAVIVTVACAGIVAELASRSLGYAERADDLIVTQGVFVKRLIVVPYGRMQFVDVTAGLLERWMGLATVRMHTAAAATDATIPGLPAAEAASLRDRLAHKGEERSMGL